MKLKRIDIQGFKSFYDKASIEFPPGVSAVVGPNGCGKSNIVDALRWVMGEQSVKQLRGKAMEDVIFAGTKGKPPLNMAEVSLTLMNQNGSGPEELKDYTEIMMTRRLYRSGESLYLLNKRPCRLKDIHNVFLGSGLGSKSYAVIQQGNIGAITDAGPDERRYFLEEAAGTTRFKNRKAEALRKIQNTNQNLYRVSDILSEIKRQMNSLKRQARKAERYKKYQNRIKDLDVHLSIHYYNELTRQIDETDALLKELKEVDMTHSTQLRKLDAAVEEIKLHRMQKNQEISEQKSQKFDTQRSIDRIENDLAHLRKDIERLTSEARELENSKIDLSEKNNKIESEIEQDTELNSRLKNDLDSIKKDLEKERAASSDIRDRLTDIEAELETGKATLMDCMAQEARYKNIYQNASNNKESLKRRLKRADEEAALAEIKLNEAGSRESEAKKELERLKQEIEELKKQINGITEQLEEKSRDLSNQVKKVQTLELEQDKAKSQYSALKKMEENFEWYRDGVQAIMKATDLDPDKVLEAPLENTKRPPDIIGLMADMIEPENSFETAVEAVLGESLQYILVAERETGIKAIDYLQVKNAGRSGFIPVTSIKNISDKNHMDPDSPKRLLNHVTVKPGFENVAEALLGHVMITEDINEAINEFDKNGSTKTIVTKGGDMISHQGMMIGGSREKISSILAKKQEVKALESRIKGYDHEIETAAIARQELEKKVKSIEIDLQKHIEHKNTIQQHEIEAEKGLYKAGEDVKAAQRHLEIVTLEQEQLLGEESDIDDELVKYNAALTKIGREIQEAQNDVTLKSDQISKISDQMEEYNQRVVDLKLKITSLNARLENSNNNLKRLKEFHDDGILRMEQLAREITRKEQKAETSGHKTGEYEQNLAHMYESIKHLEQDLEKNETTYYEIDSQLKESDHAISEIQTKREKTLEKLRLLELEQSQRGLKRENIESRLEERYHKPFSEHLANWNNRPEDDENSKDMPSPEIMEEEVERLRKKLANIGDVNLGAINEYELLKDRHNFLAQQREDLEKAIEALHRVIKKINRITQERFIETFNLANEKLKEVFPRLFEGGTASLTLTDPNNPLETGVEYMIHPPGKKLTRMSLLSGGEKALSAIAFIFSLFLIKPTSFCLMDEIDAPLDDVNVHRFNDLLKLIGEKSQIIMITHNKNSMEFADTLFGITMESKGVSKVVSVNFDRAEADRAA